MRTRLTVVVFLCLLISLPLYAQKFTGEIRGVVTDNTGAVVPDAQVNIKNDATGEERVVKTNQSGEFVAVELNPGTYTVTVKQSNFKEYVSKGVVLNVSSVATVNAQLSVGNVNEQITVEAGEIQVETSTGAVGNVIEGNEVRELPLNGRSFAQLTQLMPGVSPASNFDTKNKGLQAGVDFSVNGNNTTGNIVLVDGVNNNDIGSNRTILVYPSIDAIQEFKILRNSYGPEYGQAMGAIISLVTRSGSNSFHGGAFYDGRNDKLNATDYFNTLNGIKKDVLRRNDWGYNIGGPIAKDRLFFFFSQEWNHEQRGAARSGDVPTALEKQGDFSVGRPGQVDNGGNPCDPQPTIGGVPVTNISQVPAGGLSAGGQAYLSMLPDPNVANPVNCKNWALSLAAPIRWREENVRVDWKLGSTWSVLGRFTQDHWSQPFPSTLGFWGEDPYPSIESNWAQPGYQATIKLTKLFGSTAVNDFQVSYSANRIKVTRGGLNPGLNDTINQLAPPYYPFSQKLVGSKIGYPGFWGGCGPDCATGDNLWTQAPWHNNEQLYVLKDDFSKTIGSHSFKVGFLISNNQKNEVVNNESQENAFYWGTSSNNTGNGAFNMLWDQVVWGGGELQTNPFSQTRWHDIEPYFGDTWKVRRNVTFEYGFRWSLLRMPYSGPDRIANFEPSRYNPALGSDPCNGLVLPPGTNFCSAAGFLGGSRGQNRALKDQNNHAIAPRFGIAWDPRGDGKTSIRAGVGQFFQRERLNNTLQLATNPPFSLSAGYSRTFDTPPAPGTLSASGTPGFSQDSGNTLPNTWQWNLTVEQEVFRATKVELAYVGNRGLHILNYTDANLVPAASRQAFALLNANGLRPFGAGKWGSINRAFWGGGSNYHALQALFRTRVRAVDAQFAYTFSKSLSDTDITNSGNVNQGSLLVDPTHPGLNYGPTSINRPHIFTGNIVYNAPTMTGQNGFLRTTLGGWQVSAILGYASGPSMTTYGARAATNAPGGINGDGGSQDNLRPNLVPGQSCRAHGGPKNQWLNPNRYTLVGYVLGSPTGTASVGDCSGPPIANTDMGVAKNFKAGERITVQFRMDFFNIFNHVQFLGNAQGATFINNTIDTNPGATACGNVVCSYTPNPTYGVANKDKGPREIQYGLKLTF
ncbi:MAG: carboxypeptidase regulatory-like domain-containing protein [Acidobacteriota bacterium]|nr:carboxypeptidase regulatory-like domain-containing protein [Acidobacteriota bacterium]